MLDLGVLEMNIKKHYNNLNITTNKHLKYTNVQNIHKTERSNEGCDNIYIFQISVYILKF